MTHLKLGDTIIALGGIETVVRVKDGHFPLGFDRDGYFDGLIVRYDNGRVIGIDSWYLVDEGQREKIKKAHGYTGDGCEVMTRELNDALRKQADDEAIKAIEQINEALKQTE